MKFIDVLLESALNINVRVANINKWNTIQKNLWKKLVDSKKVEKNDVDIFLKFAKFFYSFVEKNGETPTIKQILGKI